VRPRYLPLEEYGVIGDLRTIALVGLRGGIDFCCFPRFDSPSVFARLLDADKGGEFRISPDLKGASHRQMYLPDTNVLITRFLSDEGVVEISDFMPIVEGRETSRIVRRVKVLRGTVQIRMRCSPRFDYARGAGTIDMVGAEARATSPDGSLVLRLASDATLVRDGDDIVANFSLTPGQNRRFVLEALTRGVEPQVIDRDTVTAWFKATVNFWRRWIGKSTYNGRWRDTVNRSALVLKLLQSRDTGAIVAAPTFGLPERVGGERNWDYRFTWIRDASFTLYALLRLGLTEETQAFIRWLSRRAAEAPNPGMLQSIYAIDGRTDLTEEVLGHLEGYEGSRPVRIGNRAYAQLQLDIYGELLDALYMQDKFGEPTSHDLWTTIVGTVDWVCANWQRPDYGIWEVRSGPQPFLYSRILCWVALDRGLRLADKRSLPAPAQRWRTTRDAIYADIFENFWDDENETFVGIQGSKSLDASCLIMPLVRFIAPTDPRWLATLRAVERRLMEDTLVYRYDIEGPETDGLRGPEGTFSMCSFWYIECLSRSGDLQKARFYFEKMLGYANHLGLYAEEVGQKGELVGNFPQALTHLSLISAAYDLDRRLSGAGWRA
jgi:GH15 family glucan-1,4-alpha-glucosidase